MNIFSSVRGAYSTIGTMLFLIALYLVLQHGTSATSIIGSVGNSGAQIFKTLQGR